MDRTACRGQTVTEFLIFTSFIVASILILSQLIDFKRNEINHDQTKQVFRNYKR